MAIESSKKAIRSSKPSSKRAVDDYSLFEATAEPEGPRDPLKLINDPLQDVTRKERKSLLGVSALGIAMVKAGLVPQKISALGIDFQQLNEKVLLRGLALVVL